jgi:hypothetical protein
MKRHLLSVTALVLALARPGVAAEPPSTLDVLITPIVNSDSRVSFVDVRLEIGQPAGTPRSLALRIPVVFAGVPGIADAIEGLAATDAAGPLDLTMSQDPSDRGGFIYFRHWKSTRPVSGTTTVHYRSRLAEPHPRSGPPFDLRANGGGVSGAGAGFLITPEGMGVFSTRLHWDLKNLPAGSTAACSLGDGDVTITAPPDPLMFSFYIAGPLGRYPASGSATFSAAWLGTLPFDGAKTMAWAGEGYKALAAFFKDASPKPFRVFFRVGPDNVAPGGAQLTGSFMMFLPPKLADERSLRDTIIHEMAHRWGGSLEGPNGASGWFGEGFAVRYSSLVPFKAGLLSTSDYLDLVNQTVSRFYANPLRNLPNDQIEAKFWSDRNAQILPYDRGALYYADLDAQIRKASNNARSIDSLLVSLIKGREKGTDITLETWLSTVTKELGPSAKDDFERKIVRAESWDPDPAAFGPCFTREPTVYRSFELGFDETKSLYAPRRVVQGLVPGSAAALAGLRDGDVLPQDLALGSTRDDDTKRLSFTVKRGTSDVKIDYLPRSEKTVNGFRWVRVPAVPESQCRAF